MQMGKGRTTRSWNVVSTGSGPENGMVPEQKEKWGYSGRMEPHPERSGEQASCGDGQFPEIGPGESQS